MKYIYDGNLSVNVLVSTYNGSLFLCDQLKSVYEQTHPFVRILVRDDGSSDGTHEILRRAYTSGKIYAFETGKNINAERSFFELLYKPQPPASFYAFCDQDDVWLPDKLKNAVAALQERPQDRPALYFSRLEYVNVTGEHIGFSIAPRRIGFGNAMVENIVIGCCTVMNSAARELICSAIPHRTLMHDWWCYLVIACFGEIIFDHRPTIRYRQHCCNLVGGSSDPVKLLMKKLKYFKISKRGVWSLSSQAEEFQRRFLGRIPRMQKELLEEFLLAKKSWRCRLRLASSKAIWRQRKVDDLIMRMLIFCNSY